MKSAWSVNKILIIRLSSIGDIILTFPLIREIRRKYPDSAIDFVVKREYSELVGANPYISKIWTFDRHDGISGLVRLKHILRRQQYDVIIDIHRSMRSWYLRKWMNGAMIAKYSKDLFRRWVLVFMKINLYRSPVRIVERFLHAAEKMGIHATNQELEIFIPSHMSERVYSVLNKYTGRHAKKVIAFCPGAGFVTKRWPLEKFCRLGNLLVNRKNVQIIILGGADDAALGEYIRSLVGSDVFNACGLFSILESAAALNTCDAVITNDTWLLHAAIALKKSTIALFGPTTEEMGYYPSGKMVTIIDKLLPCRPCSHNGSDRCPEGHFSCMKDISAEAVFKALMPVFNEDLSESIVGLDA